MGSGDGPGGGGWAEGGFGNHGGVSSKGPSATPASKAEVAAVRFSPHFASFSPHKILEKASKNYKMRGVGPEDGGCVP